MDKIAIVKNWLKKRIGNPYIMGGTGKTCTVAYREARAAQYPASAANIKANCPQMKSGKYGGCDGCRWASMGVGKQAYDCAQLTRYAMAEIGINLVSGSNSQWNKTEWALTGEMDSLPKDALCLLFRRDADKKMGHTGIYMGDGTAIHARGHAYGVVQNGIEESRWTHWGIPVGLYSELPDIKNDILKKGAAGERVRALQEMLLAVGQLLPRYGADGKYGNETIAAVMSFQSRMGLEDTGNVDDITWNALIDAQSQDADPGESEDAPEDTNKTISIALKQDEARALYEALKQALGGAG